MITEVAHWSIPSLFDAIVLAKEVALVVATNIFVARLTPRISDSLLAVALGSFIPQNISSRCQLYGLARFGLTDELTKLCHVLVLGHVVVGHMHCSICDDLASISKKRS